VGYTPVKVMNVTTGTIETLTLDREPAAWWCCFSNRRWEGKGCDQHGAVCISTVYQKMRIITWPGSVKECQGSIA